MEMCPSCEAASCAATQELPIILWNQKAHYCVHNNPPLVPILSQIYLVHITPSYLSKIHFNIIHSFMS
jgi:alanine dehydrogenase